MTTKHTPGPWRASCEISRGSRIHYIRAGKSTIYVAPEGCTFEAETKRAIGMTEIEVSANAHLIAAAPDLLAALEALFDDETFDPREGSLGRMTRLEGMARAAIAKAKGE